MTPSTRFYLILCACALMPLAEIVAQPVFNKPEKENSSKARPYKISTAGRQVTIKGTANIQSVMVWTSGGHRVLEQKDINASSYQFRISVNASAYFLMIRMADGKSYSEKIGLL